MRSLDARFDLLRELVEIGPFARLELGVEEFTLMANFEGTTARGNELDLLDPGGLANFGGQTGSTRLVVSSRAVFDRDLVFHWELLSAGSLSPRGEGSSGARVAGENQREDGHFWLGQRARGG